MSYNPMLEGMAVMSTGSASEALETVQNAEQNHKRKYYHLPQKMIPSKEAFEALGFIFEDIGDNILCKATLPDGWKLRLTGPGYYWSSIIDEKGRKRGSFFYKGAFFDRRGHMTLSQRFNITHIAANSENWTGPYTVLVKDSDGTVLFIAGSCDERSSDEYERLLLKAKDYLNTKYPEWENPTKYWD